MFRLNLLFGTVYSLVCRFAQGFHLVDSDAVRIAAESPAITLFPLKRHPSYALDPVSIFT